MGSPTMSTQSPQTGGKSGQAPSQAGGKGMAGGVMNSMPTPNQADGNANVANPMGMDQGSAGGKEMAGMGQGNITYPSQSGQPVMGMPNAYSNTVGQPNTPMTPMNSGAGMRGGKSSQQNGKMGR